MKERERGREESKNRDLSNRSLKKDRGTESKGPTYGYLERERGEERRRARTEI